MSDTTIVDSKEKVEEVKEVQVDAPLEPDSESKEEEMVPPFIVEVNTLLDKLEKEGMERVQQVWNEKVNPLTPEASNVFVKIMQDGADHFKEQTGRNMTYSEMRRLYG
jgi:hypothetical protein